ncbi:arylsulfatase [Tunicatimonas pelagia]|uniref:arylsulfatase n=1 Tax=Tunicatimonas pelagia TaxID=931531 RepID=UPI0026653792|nr:arylsulfatase [Tunicatimonas pelagia]WKN41877.1 arylsulfatase [Tunicatimonas pelagia]
MRNFAILPIVFLLLSACSTTPTTTSEVASEEVTFESPNIIFIMADDLGYGDLGCYGQSDIQTPDIDELAAQGIRFTQFYAGSTVCAPSRAVLMTGQHTGRNQVRGNAGGNIDRQTLRDEDITIAEVLKGADYQTALVGKWGLGEINQEGHPLKQGFDSFYGYLNQKHAHNYYPEFLWNNRDSVFLENVVQRTNNKYGSFVGGYATEKITYSHDLFVDEALEFLKQDRSNPFFLYLALTIPHANNEAGKAGMEVPDYGIYADRDWPEAQKGTAAMISRMDKDIGRIVETLKARGIDENTLIIFTSDNGPHREGGNDPDYFDSNGPLQGIKRAMHEGGIRVPFIARWPAHTPAGVTSDYIGYFGDMMATFAELAKADYPEEHTQSTSIVPTLLGQSENQRSHNYLYWEFYEQGSRQAVRMGNWKGIREPMFTGDIQLFNLENDISETNNVASQNPEVVEDITRIMDEAHEPSPNWVVKQ